MLTPDQIQKESTACHLRVKEVCLIFGGMLQHFFVVRGCSKMYVGRIEDTCAVLEVEDICLVYRILDMGEEASKLCLNETSVCAGEGASALGLSALAVTAEKIRNARLHERGYSGRNF